MNGLTRLLQTFDMDVLPLILPVQVAAFSERALRIIRGQSRQSDGKITLQLEEFKFTEGCRWAYLSYCVLVFAGTPHRASGPRAIV